MSFDSTSGAVRAVFQSIVPGTFLPPDVLTGFLPPEDATGRGKGHIGFTIEARKNLPTGTEIRNVALISFDGQTIIATNQVDPQDPSQGTDPALEALNTIDAGAPQSSVSTLPVTSTSTDLSLAVSGQDDVGGSGIAVFEFYASVNGGPFEKVGETTPESATLIFSAEHGNAYQFYSIAVDNVGHREDPPAAPDAETIVEVPTDRLPGDANEDSKVDFADFLLLSAHFGSTDAVWEAGDFNDDGQVTFEDFLILSANFGKQRPTAAPVPSSENPASAAAADLFFSEADDESTSEDSLIEADVGEL